MRLKVHFRPEFLNRIDEVIVFHELDREPRSCRWSTLMTKRLIGQLEGQGLGIELTQSAKQLLAERGYDPQLGARPLRRAIQRLIEDPLSEKILYKEFTAGEIIVVDTEDDPDNAGRAADHVLRRRGLRAPVVGRARHHHDGPGPIAGRRRRRHRRRRADHRSRHRRVT